MDLGVGAIVVKRAERGVSYYDRSQAVDRPGFKVTEADPTGAGDCFGAAFISSWRQGLPVEECLSLANAAGALAVSRQGGLEGISTRAEIRLLMTGAR